MLALISSEIVSSALISIHFVVEHLGLARFSLGDERLVQHIEHILADFLEFGLDLLTIIPNGADVLV